MPQARNISLHRGVDRPGYVWAPGYWAWNGYSYGWVRGHWILARPGYRWVPEHWQRHDGRWRYYDGYWAPEHRRHHDRRRY